MWAGISVKGATSVCIFEGNMDSLVYQNILSRFLLPFVCEKYPMGYRFMQDNDPKHTSRSTQEWLERNEVNWWPTPPESPDLNPIENLWHTLKWFLRKFVKPKTKEELIQGIKAFWSIVTPEMCSRYIRHIDKVVPVVIVRKGAASGY